MSRKTSITTTLQKSVHVAIDGSLIAFTFLKLTSVKV